MACIIFTACEVYAPNEFICDISALTTNQTVSEDQCYILEVANSSLIAKQECTNFVYNYNFQSLIMQFDLICLRSIFVPWTQFWHLLGVLLGGLITMKMIQWISPRTLYIIGMMVQIVFGILIAYSINFILHCGVRCLVAICCAIMFTAAQTIFSDITGGRYRTSTIVLYDTFWSIGVILLPGVASFFNHWTYIYLGITFPTFILIFLLNWTPDSPRWLLKNGSGDDINHVEDIVRDAAKINGRTFKIPSDFRQQLEILRTTLQNQSAPGSWFQLWRGHHRATIHMIAAHLSAAVFLVSYMGMLLNLRSFGRDYLVPNIIAMGVSELCGSFLALYLILNHNTWIWQWAGGYNIIAGLIGCLGWIFSDNDSLDPVVKVVLWMIIALIAKSAVSVSQSMLMGCITELVPPDKKLPFVFSVITWARIWLLTTPFLNVLHKYDTALSLTSYCTLGIIGGIAICLLETPRLIASSNIHLGYELFLNQRLKAYSHC